MYCKKCGKPLLMSDKYCNDCGAPVEMPEAPMDPMFKTEKKVEEPATYERVSFEPLDGPKWNTSAFPKKEAQQKTKDIDFQWNIGSDEFRNRPAMNREKAFKQEDVKEEEPSLWADSKKKNSLEIPKRSFESVFADMDKTIHEPESKTPEYVPTPIPDLPKKEEEQEKAPKVEAPVEEVVTGAALEAELFSDMEELSEAEKLRKKQTEKLDKFYTFNKKNEEFQALLDKEYEKFRAKEALKNNPQEEFENMEGMEDFYEDNSWEALREQREAQIAARAAAKEADRLALIEEMKRAEEEARAREAETMAAIAEAAAAGDTIVFEKGDIEDPEVEDNPFVELELEGFEEASEEEAEEVEEPAEEVEEVSEEVEEIPEEAEEAEEIPEEEEVEEVPSEDEPEVEEVEDEVETEEVDEVEEEPEAEEDEDEPEMTDEERIAKDKADAWDAFFSDDDEDDEEDMTRKERKAAAKAERKAEKEAAKAEKMEAKMADSPASKEILDEIEDLDDDEEEEEKTGSKVGRFFASLIAVILTVVLVAVVIRLVLPDSAVGIKVDQIMDAIVSFISGLTG